jgi:hypothetical protein
METTTRLGKRCRADDDETGKNDGEVREVMALRGLRRGRGAAEDGVTKTNKVDDGEAIK